MWKADQRKTGRSIEQEGRNGNMAGICTLGLNERQVWKEELLFLDSNSWRTKKKAGKREIITHSRQNRT